MHKKIRQLSTKEIIKLWRQRSILADDLYSKVLWPDRPVWNRYIDFLQKYYLKPIRACIKPRDLILDIGCGIGRISFWLAKTGAKVIGVDIAPNNIAIATKLAKEKGINNLEFKIEDARKLSFTNNTFDWVFSITCLCSLSSEEELSNGIREAIRVLKPGGFFVLMENVSKGPHLVSIHKDKWLSFIENQGGKILDVKNPDIHFLRKMMIEVPLIVLQKTLTRRKWQIPKNNPIERDKAIVRLYQKMPLFYKFLENLITFIGIIIVGFFEIIFLNVPKSSASYLFVISQKQS